MKSSVSVLTSLLLLSIAPFTNCKGFLESKDTEMNISDMLALLLADAHPEAADLPATVRNRHAVDGHAKNQETLSSMFEALPKKLPRSSFLPSS
jgi:hypothetical protein